MHPSKTLDVTDQKIFAELLSCEKKGKRLAIEFPESLFGKSKNVLLPGISQKSEYKLKFLRNEANNRVFKPGTLIPILALEGRVMVEEAVCCLTENSRIFIFRATNNCSYIFAIKKEKENCVEEFIRTSYHSEENRQEVKILQAKADRWEEKYFGKIRPGATQKDYVYDDFAFSNEEEETTK
eukprot:GHVP01038382.1.p1 GENE.GHVP01038382.1~~GHVP01038382.1.p1  ORF type:complete len:182 (+),score=31.02 GHVP01038382.1:428-973(+)